MGNLSEKLHLAPDILGNTTVVNLYRIDRFTKEACKIYGEICCVEYIGT